MKKILATFLVACILSSCTFGRLTSTAPYPSIGEAYFVMGVNPDDAWISIYDGNIVNGKFKMGTSNYVGGPSGGYIVGRVSPSEPLAVMHFALDKSKGEKRTNAEACNGAKTMVFTLPAGKVTYVGDLIMKNVSSKIHISSSFNAEAARQHVDQNFSHLKGKMEIGSHAMTQVENPCVKYNFIVR